MKTWLLMLTLAAFAVAGELRPIPGLKPLTDAEARVILEKGTERPFTGKWLHHNAEGTYVCKHCGAPLYRSGDKFDSHCGWPSFDDEIQGAVKRLPDPDGHRTEIVCARCGGHLGHVFNGEGLTEKNVRHCVNSLSLDFVPATRTAYFAGGCFWGVEYYLEQLEGVHDVVSGYMGGTVVDPGYRQVSGGNTGHFESVAVTYDPAVIPFEKLAKTFFEIHDPTQEGRQGPDIGTQYSSAVFYNDAEERTVINKLIRQLGKKGYNVKTQVKPAGAFYPAEAYHQDYYERHNKLPYCHGYVNRFD